MALQPRNVFTSKETKAVSFGFYSEDEIRAMSVVHVTNLETFDSLGRPNDNGLYDKRMGPIEMDSRCSTCSMSFFRCPGHMGHIDLCATVYHPLMFELLHRLLKSMCLYCHHFKLSFETVYRYAKRLELLDAGLLFDAEDIMTQPIIHSHLDEEKKPVIPKHRIRELIDEEARKRLHAAAKAQGITIQQLFTDSRRASSTHVYMARKEAIDEFFQLLTSVAACENCGGASISIRKDQNANFFRLPLNSTQVARNEKAKVKLNLFTDDNLEVDLNDIDTDDANQKGASEDANEKDEKRAEKLHLNKGKPVLIEVSTVEELMKDLWSKERDILPFLFGTTIRGYRKAHPYSSFFLRCVPVTASKFRPANHSGNRMIESPHTLLWKDIMIANMKLRRSNKNNPVELMKDLTALQIAVNVLMDSAKGVTAAQKDLVGVRQVLEKKQGLFRKNMMGKRVNYAARSVISPDPYIETNEIGVPVIFARKWNYPEPVTPYNVQKLRQLVINGPNKYPGANAVSINNVVTDLTRLDKDARIALSKQLLTNPGSNYANKVYRHLQHHDVLLVNRQPTLHKPSMMCHKARILPQNKCIRLHYANCNTYNADFDGDEINLHFAQNELARAEGYGIAITDNQYLVPTSGKPIRGLIQDHVVSAVLLTKRDSFYTKEEYHELVYGCLFHRCNDHIIETVPPCILKPQPLWSGKQIITTLLNDLTRGSATGLNLDSTAKVPGDHWGPYSEDGQVVVRDNELLVGVLDKNQFGASAYGLVHGVYECFGADIAGQLLTCLGRLFTLHLQLHGFTCGMDDLVLQPAADEFRAAELERAREAAIEATKTFAGKDKDAPHSEVEAELAIKLKDDRLSRQLDASVKAALNKHTSNIIKNCLPSGQMKPFPENNLSMMTVSGAKGGLVNFSQISCLLGQQEFEGRRAKPTPSGKTLPSFSRFDESARAGGYVTGRFLTGIKPQEYFFHCMAGRDGLIDTAVKTSRSGYLQRCLIKHLEGLKVAYDDTVRDSSGEIIQFHYGEDSLDPTKVSFMEKFTFISMNAQTLANRYKLPEISNNFNIDGDADPLVKKYLDQNRNKKDSMPVLDVFPPHRHIGAVSERYSKLIDKYIQTNPDGFVLKDEMETSNYNQFAIPEDSLRVLLNIKYLKTLVDPGEAVGLLAAQSIGEPSTQMTLNTFHFAGLDIAGVTVGIPRLREILMTGSVKQQTMSLPVQASKTGEAKKLATLLSRIPFFDVLEKVSVAESFYTDSENDRYRRYEIDLYWETDKAENEFYVPSSVFQLKAADTFLKIFLMLLKGQISQKGFFERTLEGAVSGSRFESSAEISGREGDDADADDDGEGDEVFSRKKKKNKKSKNTGDDDDDEGDDAKSQSKKKKGYEDEDEDDEAEEERLDDEEVAKAKKNRGAADEDEDMMEEDEDEEEEDEEEANTKATKKAKKAAQTFAELVKELQVKYSNLEDVDYDAKTGLMKVTIKVPARFKRVLMVSLVEKAAKRAPLRNPANINKTTVNHKNDGSVSLMMEGCNFEEVWKYDSVLDINNITTNDVAFFAQKYGIEAARAVVVKELGMVFDLYGIGVDNRHLNLIADFMSFPGKLRSFNYRHMAQNPQPFQQMSFESTIPMLLRATLHGDPDMLHSPSARIVMGKVVESGTGCVELLSDLSQQHMPVIATTATPVNA